MVIPARDTNLAAPCLHYSVSYIEKYTLRESWKDDSTIQHVSEIGILTLYRSKNGFERAGTNPHPQHGMNHVMLLSTKNKH